jgi:hypothetical protein
LAVKRRKPLRINVIVAGPQLGDVSDEIVEDTA